MGPRSRGSLDGVHFSYFSVRKKWRALFQYERLQVAPHLGRPDTRGPSLSPLHGISKLRFFFFFIFFPNFIRLASSAFRSETFRIRKLGFLEIGEGIEIAMERKKYPIRAEDYQLFEMIGQGVSASVHRARCIPLAEVVAIKILDFERHNSDLVSSSCRDLALNLICFWLFVDMELGWVSIFLNQGLLLLELY